MSEVRIILWSNGEITILAKKQLPGAGETFDAISKAELAANIDNIETIEIKSENTTHTFKKESK